MGIGIFSGASVVTAILIFSLGSARAQSWHNANQTGDWAGRDRACSQGAIPRPEECTDAYIGQVAVCWPNRRTGECKGATAWCTYKFVKLGTIKNGGAPGNIYECRKD
jgi:hypothetical protein